MSRNDSIVEVQFARHRWLMQKAERRMEGWRKINEANEFPYQSKYLQGRYLAAREFYEWLANGGQIADAKAWLEERKKQRLVEYERFEAYETMHILAAHVEAGRFTDEEAKRWRVYTPGFKATDEEREELKGVSTMNKAGEVEFWHLERLLNDPFVKGEVSEPLPPPPPAVVDPDDVDDDEPD